MRKYKKGRKAPERDVILEQELLARVDAGWPLAALAEAWDVPIGRLRGLSYRLRKERGDYMERGGRKAGSANKESNLGVFLLSEVDAGTSLKEIAQELCLPYNRVRNALYRFRKKVVSYSV